MALGYSVVNRSAFGDLFARVVDVTLDNAYQAGGYTPDPQGLGFGKNGVILAMIPVGSRGGFFTDFSGGKLMVRDASGAAGAASPEVGNNNAAINGLVQRFLVLGKGQG